MVVNSIASDDPEIALIVKYETWF